MTRYKIRYERTIECEMVVEANSVEEAKKKYEEFDIISNNEVQGIEEKIIKISEFK